MRQAVFGIITEADISKILKLSNEALPEIVADKTESYKSDSALHPQHASVLTSQCFQSLHHCCFLLTTYTLRQYENILTTTVFLKVLCQNNQRIGSHFKKKLHCIPLKEFQVCTVTTKLPLSFSLFGLWLKRKVCRP